MKEQAYEKICGNMIDPKDATEEDVRAMAKQWAESGEPCDDDEIEKARRLSSVVIYIGG